MPTIEACIDVHVPVQTAYDQWGGVREIPSVHERREAEQPHKSPPTALENRNRGQEGRDLQTDLRCQVNGGLAIGLHP